MQKHYWLHLVLTVFLSLLLCNSAKAYMTIDDYQESKKRDQIKSAESTDHYIIGVANGFIVSNITLKDRGDKLLYCQPDTLSLPVSFYTQLIDDFIEKEKLDSKLMIDFIMLFLLEKAFPCGQD